MAVPAPPNILTKLPFDIRNQIWINVLSQTGYVKVVPERHFRSEKLCIFEVSNNSSPNEATAWDFHGTIDLSLLRTCIQIYEETQEMFWRYNTLVLYPMRRGFISQYSDMLEEELGSVMHVRFEIDFCSIDQWNTEQTFRMLGIWAREGNLKTLEVCPTQGLLNFLEIVDAKAGGTDDGPRMVFQEYIWILRKARSYLDCVDRKISINTGWQGEFLGMGKQKTRYGSTYRSSFQVILDTLEEIHDAFGGELRQDGKLCYKDGIQVGQPFQPNAQD